MEIQTEKGVKAEERLNLTYYGGSDIYSDGAVEDRLLEIAKTHSEAQLNEVIAKTKDWSI